MPSRNAEKAVRQRDVDYQELLDDWVAAGKPPAVDFLRERREARRLRLVEEARRELPAAVEEAPPVIRALWRALNEPGMVAATPGREEA